MRVSPNLRAALRYEGYAKVSAVVMRSEGEYLKESSDYLNDAAQSLAVKIAVNRINEKTINTGVASFQRFMEL